MDTARFDRFTIALGTRLSRRRAIAAGVAGLSALVLPAVRVHPLSAQDATPAAGEAQPVFLFVQLADAGTWTPKPDEEGVYLLTLTGTGEQTLYFSDRPDRITGAMPTDRFLQSLGFTPINPPNAAVVVQTPEGTRDVLVVELYNPVYTLGFGEKEGVEFLTYEAKVLNAYTGAGLEEWAPQAEDDQLPQAFTNVSLFIDDCAGLNTCILSRGPTTFEYVGTIPGGPYQVCFNPETGICELCEGSYAEFDALCRDAYPDVCAQGVCFTNVCDFAEYFGEMYYC